ncbi:transmembrane emp24 domain-containing protein 3 [Clarias gariepinus]|uniref:transmembrane emp24 domain-containing protein 3 n=1 Tax=Clarias gariepinus TaxID=13013 RepID=UPI00234DD996|nr:transmembrane emp24 domain-containing protein 3 [Clarias gariepinus]
MRDLYIYRTVHSNLLRKKNTVCTFKNMFGVAVIILTLYSALISGTELTFELPDNEKQCFYEEIEEGVTFHVDYQVIAGGNYDVDCFVTDPLNNALYDERKKQYDSFTHTTAMKGVYKVCFSNEFSTFSHKTVYLDFRAGEQERLLPGMSSPTALTQIESTCLSIHEILKVVADTQTKYRLREAQDRLRAEDLNLRVSYWSIGEAVIICMVSIGQVLMLKSFFKEKKSNSI